MKLTKSRKVYLAALGLAATAFLGDRLFLDPGGTGPQPADASPPGPARAAAHRPPAPIPPPSPGPRGALADRLRSLVSPQELDSPGPRDAFAPPKSWFAATQAAGEGSAEPSAAERFIRDHTLTSMVLGEGGGSVIVNGKVIQMGEEVNGFRLVGLSPGCAVFRRGEDRVELRLHREHP